MQALALKKPQPVAVVPEYSEDAIGEYLTVANQIGLQSPELVIARFKAFMAKNNLPIYDLKTVCAYMDGIAKRDNKTGYGWHWSPLRKQDQREDITAFGTPSRSNRDDIMMWQSLFIRRVSSSMGLEEDEPKLKKKEKTEEPKPPTPGSDYFTPSATVYEKPVPLHALKRVHMIEREFGKKKIAFAVSDYATEPHIQPDPFLLAIIPNAKLADGVGRFVIDVWDEPGFGILDMVK